MRLDAQAASHTDAAVMPGCSRQTFADYMLRQIRHQVAANFLTGLSGIISKNGTA